MNNVDRAVVALILIGVGSSAIANVLTYKAQQQGRGLTTALLLSFGVLALGVGVHRAGRSLVAPS